MTTETDQPFWKTKRLDQMTHEEWESVCDRCAKCCYKRYVMKSGKSLKGEACSLLDEETRSCRDYENRLNIVKGCIKLTKDNMARIAPYMPETCAYRLLAEGKDLPEEHHLVKLCEPRKTP